MKMPLLISSTSSSVLFMPLSSWRLCSSQGLSSCFPPSAETSSLSAFPPTPHVQSCYRRRVCSRQSRVISGMAIALPQIHRSVDKSNSGVVFRSGGLPPLIAISGFCRLFATNTQTLTSKDATLSKISRSASDSSSFPNTALYSSFPASVLDRDSLQKVFSSIARGSPPRVKLAHALESFLTVGVVDNNWSLQDVIDEIYSRGYDEKLSWQAGILSYGGPRKLKAGVKGEIDPKSFLPFLHFEDFFLLAQGLRVASIEKRTLVKLTQGVVKKTKLQQPTKEDLKRLAEMLAQFKKGRAVLQSSMKSDANQGV